MIQAFLTENAEILPFLRETMDGEVFDISQVRPCRVEPAPQLQSVYHGFHGEVENVKARAVMFCEGEPVPTRSKVRIGSGTFVVLACTVYHGFPGSYLEVTLA